MEKQKSKNKEKRDKFVFVGMFILMLLLAGFLVYLFSGMKGAYGTFRPEDDSDKINITLDDDVQDGGLSRKSKEEIVAALNEKVADGMINISMNSNPVFESGTAKGTLMITNNEINRYPQQIEIYRTDTDELIYSGAVGVGQSVETGDLSVDLPAGKYDCIAVFHAVNPETAERVGTAKAKIKITVLE